MGQPVKEMTSPHVHFNENTTNNDYVQAVPQNTIVTEGNAVPAVRFTDSTTTVDSEQDQIVTDKETNVTNTTVTLLPGSG